MKNYIIGLVVLVALSVGGYYAYEWYSTKRDTSTSETSSSDEVMQDGEGMQDAVNEGETKIGTSVEGRAITAYHYGEGEQELLFVGGIHGGYEWNTVLVAYELMDYLEGNPEVIPQNERVTVIPVLNPDGLNKTVGTDGRFSKSDVPTGSSATVPGRFNANEVDLNRNFDCDWRADATWQNRAVSGGSEAFSEPESQAVRDYIKSSAPAAVLVWYSAANGVFASNCHNGVLSETSTLTKLYAEASGYPAYQSFDFYEVTGDMVNWLAKEGVPAISVLLSTHEDVEWSKNQAGVEALLEYYAK